MFFVVYYWVGGFYKKMLLNLPAKNIVYISKESDISKERRRELLRSLLTIEPIEYKKPPL